MQQQTLTPEVAAQLQKAQGLKRQVNAMAQKVADLELQLNDHTLVLNTMKDLEDTRVLQELVGGVLVESNVGAVKPDIDVAAKRLGR